MLLTHGARSVLREAKVATLKGQEFLDVAPLGAHAASPIQSRQGDLRARQQDGVHLLLAYNVEQPFPVLVERVEATIANESTSWSGYMRPPAVPGGHDREPAADH